jgi:3-oxoacyl-[acyl-carrier protein] reductase
LARELGSYGITVNAVAPGLTSTEATQSIFSGGAAAMFVGMQAIPKQLSAEDLRGIIAFLAGSGSDFITGQVFVVDGGLHFQ